MRKDPLSPASVLKIFGVTLLITACGYFCTPVEVHGGGAAPHKAVLGKSEFAVNNFYMAARRYLGGTLELKTLKAYNNDMSDILTKLEKIAKQYADNCNADKLEDTAKSLKNVLKSLNKNFPFTMQGDLGEYTKGFEGSDHPMGTKEQRKTVDGMGMKIRNRMIDLILKARRDAKTCKKVRVIKNNKNVDFIELNFCRDKAEAPNDPYFHSTGSWGQTYDDQWAIKRVGFTAERGSAWDIEDGTNYPIVVAVIDTGLDWNHKDIDWKNIWRNGNEIPDNGIDDDGNGYVDDIIGWNFVADDNVPWDEDGHGTFVTGIIAAATNNGVGIAGINRGARVMVLKALNAFGHTRASFLSEAIFYAANNGARVINISAGGKHLTRVEQDAVNYAHKMGAVIVVAAGNEAMNTADYSPSGLDNVIAVATTEMDDKRAGFSNWGQGVSIAAPGMDVLSLRARRTDLMLGIPEVEYTPKLSYVGRDNRYYRASGSSFSAPIVAATASLILAKDPTYTNTEVERVLLQSAKDIDVPGFDQHTGFGLLDARAALMADPNYYLTAEIHRVRPVQEEGKMYLEVLGTVDSSNFKEAAIELGPGEAPEKWKVIATVKEPLAGGRLGLIPSTEFTQRGKWTIRLKAVDKKGKMRESRASVDIQ